MSSPGRTGSDQFSKFAFKGGAGSGGGGGASSKASGKFRSSNSKRSSRRIVEDDNGDDDDEDVLTSTDMKRNVPRTGPTAAGSIRAKSPENDEGTSSGEEDTQWFKQPSAESAVTVKRANAIATNGNPGWMSKNDPKKLTASDREKNIQKAKAQRAQQKGKKGGKKEEEEGASRSRRGAGSSSNHKKKSGVHGGGSGGGSRRKRGGGRGGESEASCGTGDSDEEEAEDEDEEGEFESGDDESDDELPDLTDESEASEAEGEEEGGGASSVSSPVAPPVASVSAAAKSASSNPWTHAKGSKSGASGKRAAAIRSASSGSSRPVTTSANVKRKGSSAETRKFEKNGSSSGGGGGRVSGDQRKRSGQDGGVDAGGGGSKSGSSGGGSKSGSSGGGSKSGGSGGGSMLLKGAVAGMDVEISSSSGNGSSSSSGNNRPSKDRSGRDPAATGGGSGLAWSGVSTKSGSEARQRRRDAPADNEAKAAVGGGRGGEGQGHGGDGGNAGGSGGKRSKAKRKIVAIAEDESDDDEEEQVVVPREKAPKQKKNKVSHVRGDDDMDDSDRGSGSDDDDGARAKKVLEECSALSKKLASVLSSWAASDGNEGTAAGGALGLTHMKQRGGGGGGGAGGAEGKAVTSNEEIEGACPGLTLKPYQLVGVNWMCLLRGAGVNGVLADEMGLGKTVQTIAFFALLRHRRQGTPPKRPHLIVVPSSVLDNWDSELKKFCPALVMVKYHGSQKDRTAIRQNLNRVSCGADRAEMPDIVLTTYVMWERESCGDDRTFLKRFKYDYMVLDEGHSIKNIKSSRFQRLRMVTSKHRLLLSGTPVQNNLGELLALLSFLMPNIFRHDVIETLLEFLAKGDSSSKSSASSAFQHWTALRQQLKVAIAAEQLGLWVLLRGGSPVGEVRGMLAPFVLRRLKSSVLKQLVAKTEMLELVPLSKVQKSVYDGVLEEHLRQKKAAIERALAAENAPCQINSNSDDNSAPDSKNSKSKGKANGTRPSNGKTTRSTVANGKKRPGGNAETAVDVDEDLDDGKASTATGTLEAAGISAKEIKNVFTELRKGANHPLMLLNYFKGGEKLEEVISVLHRTGYFGPQATKDMVVKEVQTYSDFDLHQICSTFDALRHLCLPEEALWTSAKMERLRTLLPDLVAKGHRVLVFSQWTRLLDLLEVLLNDAMGLSFCRLDGSTPVSERKALIDKFGADRSIPVFLLSTRAGGLGINLTSADTVILHDCDFNPENDRQAEDRCHRIGQTKPVTVIKMVAQGTVDEDIYSMGERKKEVNKSVLNDSASKEHDAASTISGILKKAIQVHLASSPR